MACGIGTCSYPLDLSHFSGPTTAERTDRIRPGHWLSTIVAMHERWRQRQALMELDDRLLADIGISRDERRAELEKPFWR